jgi:hypothetical protein
MPDLLRYLIHSICRRQFTYLDDFEERTACTQGGEELCEGLALCLINWGYRLLYNIGQFILINMRYHAEAFSRHEKQL